MKIIDADGFASWVYETKAAQASKNTSYRTGYISALSTVEGMLASVPEIKNPEAVRGEWEVLENPKWPGNYLRCCSECGWEIPENKLRKRDLQWHYCPNCGANMRGNV